MIDLAQYAAFLGVSLLVICTPGQDTALTVRNTLMGGRRAGVATAAGVSLGQIAWTVATSAGLAVVLTASAPLFFAVRIAGAAYLLYLGVRSIVRAAVPRDGRHAPEQLRARGLPRRAGFAQGFVSNLSNAKMVAFFVSLLPQFAGPHPSVALLIALGINFGVLTLAWLTAYAFAVDRLSGWLLRGAVRRAMDAALGAVLAAFGLRITAEALAG